MRTSSCGSRTRRPLRRDVNDLAFWFPLIEEAGLPVPETRIVKTDCELADLLDGNDPEGFWPFIGELHEAALEIGGPPFFLRTGHGSGKHEWRNTCFVDSRHTDILAHHVASLVEWSHLADMMGLPHQTWVVRKMIDTQPLFRCAAWQGFPVTREFRVFIRDDEFEAIYPYWPADAVAEGRPTVPYWRQSLKAAAALSDDDNEELPFLAGMASGAVGGGYWSIDFLQDRHGKWWLTDMADGDRSFRPE
jgi:hypothetical protein